MEECEKWVIYRVRDDIIQDFQPKYVMKELISLNVVTKNQEKEIMSYAEEEHQTLALLSHIENGGEKAYNGFKKCLQTEEKYYWLVDILNQNYNEIAGINVSNLSNILIRGGVPRLVPNAIQRKPLLKTLKAKLRDLSNLEAGWVTIHGMGGYGKTMLASAAVRDLLLIYHLFPHGVFWIKIGNGISEDILMNKMHALCEKIDSSFCGKLPCDLEMAADRLRTLFGSEAHNQCLVVLDDVWSDLAIRNFDLGCRILVTTRDRSIMEVASTEVAYVELKVGFTLEETKQFFANSHKVRVEELPQCVSEIWNTAQGYPLVMAIINTKVGEHQENIDEAFRICLSKLQNNSLFNLKNRMPYEYSCLAQALEMSFDTLGSLKEFYYDLSIFPDDCYISRDVLVTLWQKDKWDVDEIMNNFTNKALAMQVPNGHNTTYYTIHDLYLQFMRSNSEVNMKKRHERLINRYLDKSGGRFSKISNDGYILLYLGYHLQNAQMWNKFPEIFLDLNFVLTKLAAAGPADLLGDFDRYNKYISQEGTFSKELNDFERFVRSCTHLLTNPLYDMLQIAISQPSHSEVYQQANRICIERSQKSYFVWCNRDKLNSPCKLSTRLHPNGPVSITILEDSQYIASGGYDGVIKIWNFSSGRVVSVLKGHSKRVSCLISYRDSSDLLIISSSGDQTVRVWRLAQKDLEIRKKKKVNTITMSAMIFHEHKAPVICCSVCIFNGHVASFDETGVIQIWKVGSGEVISFWQVSISATCLFGGCDFTIDGNGVITAENSMLRLWDFKKKIPIWEIEMKNGSFSSCHVSPNGKEVLATLNSNLIIYDIQNGSQLSTLSEPRGRWLHSCCSHCSGEFVSAGNMENAVVVWDKQQHKAIDYLHGHKDNVNNVAFMPSRVNEDGLSDGIHLVSAAADGTVMIWKTALPSKKFDAILKEIYSVQFDEDFQPFIAVADMNNQIQVTDIFQEIISGEVVSPTPNFSISCCVLAHKCDEVLFGSTNGHLQMFSVISGVTKKMGKLQKEITCCAFSKDDVHMAAGAADGNILIFTKESSKDTYGHSNYVTNIMFYQDDLRLISSSFDSTLIIWNVADGKQMFQCLGHQDSVVDSDINAQLIVSASTDKIFKIWNGNDGECLYSSGLHSACVRCVRFSADGTKLLSGDDFGDIRLWSLSKYLINRRVSNCLASLVNDNHVILLRKFNNCVTDSWISDMRFSSDGFRFVTCADAIHWWSTDEVIKEGENLKPIQTFPIRGRKVGKIFCSDDFETFITVDDTGVLYCLRMLKKF